ncbi:hypothetical protein BDW02DRAFT_583193 [Decorospora gaudefroyi]|uniref:Uncharacterized protein n=1 Tax=Decorospora gaudefroyi TaxID=184978 RepID=A0A6A5K5J8_9PLEO|nr:hypothetical protein BDW02DRAFT_583193 [Decorospora gaudefroyi]
MALNAAAIAGIVVTVLALLTICFGTILCLNRRHTNGPKCVDEEQRAHSPELHLPGPIHSAHRKRNPRTFYDWVRAPHNSDRANTNNNALLPDGSPDVEPPRITGIKKCAQEHHTRFPSLENGPGPTITESVPSSRTITSRFNSENYTNLSNISSISVTPTTPATPATPSTAATVLKTVRPSTSGSNRPSSLRQAVMGIGEERKSEEKGAEHAKEKVEANVERKVDGDARPKGYTGAWP